MRLLVAAPGPPSPGGKGYQVRLYNQILGLAGRHEVTLLTFKTAGETIDPDIIAACRRVTTVRWSVRSAAFSALLHASRLPLSVGLYHSRRMEESLAAEIGHGCDLAHLQLVRMAPYLRAAARVPVVLDLLDAAELNMRERARATRPGVRQVLEFEAQRLGACERQAVAKANLSLLISQRDFQYLGSPPNARVLPNGVEPRRQLAEGAERRPATVLFSGTMSYFPNADAATWFVREILPLVRQAVPAAQFRIVGRAPNGAVRRVASAPGVTVTGAVSDMALEISRAAVSVCPMRFGSGMQTKILEAMATQTPIVATSKALEGIPEDLRQFVRQADTPHAFAESVVQTLSQPERARETSAAALDVIERRHTWQHVVNDLERLYEETIATAEAG